MVLEAKAAVMARMGVQEQWLPPLRRQEGPRLVYYTCHMPILVLTLEAEFMKRVVKGRETCKDKNTLQGKYNWIPEGWAMEIRVGWEEKKKKIFKIFLHKSSGMRLLSTEDVSVFEGIVGETKIPAKQLSLNDALIFEEVVKGRKASRGTADTVCDTSSQDNIVAQLDFYTSRLSAGWVKETAFRKCSEGVRKDRYFTDPISHLVFRTKKSANQYFWTQKIHKDGTWPTQSVTEKYFSDECKEILDKKGFGHQYEPQGERPGTSGTS